MAELDMVPATLGGRLRWARQLVGISARELDRLTKKTEGHLATIETKLNNRASLATIADYASVLGVSIDWLESGEGKAPTRKSIAAAVEAARAQHAESDRTGT